MTWIQNRTLPALGWLLGLASVLTFVIGSQMGRHRDLEALRDAEYLAVHYNTGVLAAFNSLGEADSAEQAVAQLLAGSEATSCWGPRHWPAPELPSARIEIAKGLLVFEKHVNPNSIPEETVPALKVRGTEIDWLKPEA